MIRMKPDPQLVLRSPNVQTLFQLQKHPCHGYTALRIHAPKSNRALLALGAARRRADQTHEQDEETFAKALYKDDEAAALDDLREAVTTLEEMERTAQRAARARRRPRSQRELIPACVSRE